MYWSNDQLKILHRLIAKEKKTPAEAGKIMGISEGACSRKFGRVNWKTFLKGDNKPKNKQEWKDLDLQRLYDLHVLASMDFIQIGSIMKRTPVSCERMFQITDWKHRRPKEELLIEEEKDNERRADEKSTAEFVSNKYVEWMMELARYNPDRLLMITKEALIEKAKKALPGFKESDLPLPFNEIKRRAQAGMDELGLKYPEEKKFGKGTYIIVGDSHGKHTKKGMFRLLHTVNKHLRPDQIIHVGHAFDDDDEISYLWDGFSHLTIIGIHNELCLFGNKSHADIVRSRVTLGDLIITNQYDITDYVAKYIGRIASRIFPTTCVVNCHRHEMYTRCTNRGSRLIVSPGCVCEPHIHKTIKQDFIKDKGSGVKRQIRPFGYHKYDRADHMKEYWEQGLLVVEVDKDGKATIHPCRIQKIGKKGKEQYCTSFLDKIYTESGVRNPDQKIFINGDLHCDLHDPNVLDIQRQFCGRYKPDTHINIGDTINNKALNHHEMAKTGGPLNKDMLREIAHTKYVVNKMRTWAQESFAIIGNHERFMLDFIAKFPQMASMLDFEFLIGTSALKIEVTPLKGVLKVGPIKFIHGDVKMYGQAGCNKLEKAGATFGSNTVMGNIHYPAIRTGCYSIGLTGLMDQQYNEIEATQWLQGFAYCNLYGGVGFVSLVNIIDGQCVVGGKVYRPQNPAEWDLPDFTASINFDFAK